MGDRDIKLLHALLTNSAKRRPEGTAVRSKGKKISYHELDAASNKLAYSLIKKSTAAGDRVGIYMDKSIDAVIAIFAVLKAGACYVPLDPTAPPERQRIIINDCSIRHLVASSKKLPLIEEILKKRNALEHIFITDAKGAECSFRAKKIKAVFGDDIAKAPTAAPRMRIEETDLAYILYTSGSTGKPKGVMVSHRASRAFVDWAHKEFCIKGRDIVSAHAPFCFDLSVFDIFVTVSAAATICIVPQGVSGFPRSLAEFIKREGITVWYSVPSALVQLILHGGLKSKEFPKLKKILFAGEVFPVKHLRELMRLMSGAKYYNLYGPTETNVCAFYHVNAIPKDEAIPIGKACAGARLFVADADGNPVKRGETGELYAQGPSLMDAYWNDPAKTEEAFCTGSFSKEKSGRIYKTGDRVRRGADKNLWFRGRCDEMIKSRGYRVELGEIESILNSHKGLIEAAAVAVPHAETGSIIKTFICRKEGSGLSEEKIRSFCAKRLPGYMVPDEIIFKESFPKTSTAKVDKKRLKAEAL